jgi:hypothetical protein|tara:strand:- start:33 stop:170 length:138 start_codon:yes stop_codon:yes gene_type:complete
MILEQIVKDILKEEYDRIKTMIPYDGMYDRMAERIVKEVKNEIVR